MMRWLRFPWRRRDAMSCDEVGRRLQHHLDGVLDEPRTQRLLAHLEECRRCGLEAETYERIKRSLAERRSPLPPDTLERLREFGAQLAGGDGAAPP
jgi:anti-sigma factor RsiW